MPTARSCRPRLGQGQGLVVEQAGQGALVADFAGVVAGERGKQVAGPAERRVGGVDLAGAAIRDAEVVQADRQVAAMPHDGRRLADHLLLQRDGPLVPADRVGGAAAAAQERGEVVVAQGEVALVAVAARLRSESRSSDSTASRMVRSAAAGSRLATT